MTTRVVGTTTGKFLIEGARGAYWDTRHCVSGVNRSAVICLAYLMVSRRWSMMRAVRRVRAQRPFILSNTGFQEQVWGGARGGGGTGEGGHGFLVRLQDRKVVGLGRLPEALITDQLQLQSSSVKFVDQGVL